MMSWFADLISVSTFSPHGFCLAWEPETLSWTIIGDGMISLAYLLIPLELIRIIFQMRSGRRLVLSRKPWVLVLFSLFILLCGIGHALEVGEIWVPYYRLMALEKTLTGIVSLVTAAMLQFTVWPEENEARSEEDK